MSGSIVLSPVGVAGRALLRESFELALERDDDFPRLFYDILFHRHREIEAMFGEGGRGLNSMDAQRRMFASTLLAILDRLDDEVWLARTLEPMGKEHVAYGVTPPMYGYVRDAFIAALVEVCAASWTPAHDEAWRVAFDHISAVMLRGAA